MRKPHAALNTLFQSTGSLVMKKALVITHKEYLWREIASKAVIKVLDMHDEGLLDVVPDFAELSGQAGVQGIIDAGEFYNLNCSLNGEFKIGKNYAEVH